MPFLFRKMARTKFKWKFGLFFYLILVNVCTKSFPISTKLPDLVISDTVFHNNDVPDIEAAVKDFRSRVAAIVEHEELVLPTDIPTDAPNTDTTEISDKSLTSAINNTRNALLRQVRPGQEIRQYAIELTVNGNSFTGRAVIDLVLDTETREDPIVLHAEDLNIRSVLAGVFTDANAVAVDFDLDDGLLEIEPGGVPASSYILIIEYSGSLTNVGQGLFIGDFHGVNYLAMNLHPTHARRVFPCMDEPTEASIISFTFNGVEYNHIMTNSLAEDNQPNQFRALQGPPHLWSMVAHNLNIINVPTTGVSLYIRPGVTSQESQASVALNFYYNNLVEWTNKPYFEIVLNQADQLRVLALPDVSREWYGLSTVPLWEPYILMENPCSIRQRFVALQNMAEAMARQWFGHVIYPENWRYQWVVSGLASYAGFDLLKGLENDVTGLDITLLDVETLFVTEVIQESLYQDGYSSTLPLEIGNDLFDEDEIRDYINGIHKVKAPALLWMFRLILGDANQDFIQQAGRALLAGRALQTVNYLIFVDAINANWVHSGNGRVDDIADFMEPWVENNGYPLIHIGLRQGGVLVTQERFGYSSLPHVAYNLPITYSVSNNPNFDNIYPIEMMEGTMTFNMFLDDDDFVLFNVRGQGYYRVNYDNDLWERIIEALEDPDRRAEIHPLNRATLIDDAFNLARGGRIDYEIALLIALSMEHETEYAPWKAFIRNMKFLEKRLEALILDDEDLDPDIYLRMIRRTIGAFEDQIGFSPDPLLTEPAMTSLTRGLVMDHACRAGYQPCIAAAVDWFWNPDTSEPQVNPNIPKDIRPAVYCAMVREGGSDVIEALYNRLDVELSMWERVVILESLACSSDSGFIRTLLEETIAVNSPYSAEEKMKIFIATAESGYDNARIALSFISQRINEIRNMYNGDDRLEELIHVLAENMADSDLSSDFTIWVFAQNNNMDDSQMTAERAAAVVEENQNWVDVHLEYVYEWIDDNDAPTLAVSLLLISISLILGLFNH